MRTLTSVISAEGMLAAAALRAPSCRDRIGQLPQKVEMLIGVYDWEAELPQTIRKNIRGDPFTRFLKVLKGSVATHHQIADDEQRPAISKPLERDTHRAAGSAS